MEFKLDPRDGQPKLMEVNPRFWAYLELPIRCGVNFPLLLHELCLGVEFDPVLSYHEGVGYINVRPKPTMLLKGLISVPRTGGLVLDWLDIRDPRRSLAEILLYLKWHINHEPVAGNESLQEILRNQPQRGKK